MLARAIRKRRGQGGDKRGTAFNTPAKPEGGDDGVKDGADEETKPRRRKKKGKGLSRQIYGLHNVIFFKDKKIKFDTTTETLEISNDDDDLKKKKKAARRKKKDKNEDKLRFDLTIFWYIFNKII